MTRIGDRSIDGDHGLQVDKICLAYVKHFGIGCLFDILLIINGIIYWFSTLWWKEIMWGFKIWIYDGWILNVLINLMVE